MVLCPGCGNDIVAGEECGICSSGRGAKRKRREPDGTAHCNSCDVPMEEQDWDGVTVHMCPSCQRMLFPPNALERVLDKLRDTAEHIDFTEVVRGFRERYRATRAKTSVRELRSRRRKSVSSRCFFSGST